MRIGAAPVVEAICRRGPDLHTGWGTAGVQI
jgi:hypothetical protein